MGVNDKSWEKKSYRDSNNNNEKGTDRHPQIRRNWERFKIDTNKEKNVP